MNCPVCTGHGWGQDVKFAFYFLSERVSTSLLTPTASANADNDKAGMLAKILASTRSFGGVFTVGKLPYDVLHTTWIVRVRWKQF